jgi:hypothetical protein
MLGRPDLAPGYNAVIVRSDGTSEPAQVGGTPLISGSFNTGVSGQVGVGQVGLGLVATGIVVLFAWYAFTRSVQK